MSEATFINVTAFQPFEGGNGKRLTVTAIGAVQKRQIRVRTNTAGEVAMYASGAGVAVYATVISFEWSRR